MNGAHAKFVADEAYRWGGLTMMAAVGAIAVAHGFEHIGGYRPCMLCLQQRWAYYAGIPLAFAGLVVLAADRRKLAGLLLLAVALGFLANAGLGVYHAGIEWKLWAGPQTCEGTQQTLGGRGPGVLGSLGGTRMLRCDEAPWRFGGLSFAGWNAVISLGLFVSALKAAFAATAKIP